ncbi:mechanosensitive ion channel [Candidatus Sulfidibacterium hydrothermale]|uniref:mechanosensitive ion channel family protein n=1 Tax=Candidatus Sulfidibacterium hydrothermale TaxID=2875962 RepID=UPI001F0B5FBB|nr:mechanosensitive ion channel domain-containing protein [Candidatus Sulfidibacterium hydrothermale]UBM62924.1 mechanosensitive ion channel [Candidatus Sulfidibacterium hydrothermale]
MENLDTVSTHLNQLLRTLSSYVSEYGLRLIGALVVLVVGLWIVKLLVRSSQRLMDKSKLDISLTTFLKSMIDILLKVLLIISVMGMMGIQMTSFIAILGAAGLAVGMALSGTLQNFAGGVMILIFKPFKVGDFINAQGYSGVVKEIRIFVTVLTTPDNKTIFIPNGPLSNGSLTNFSTQPNRRVDWTFGIAYGDDYDKAKAMLLDMMKEDKRILTDPEPFVALGELADSSVNLTVRAWVKAADYWGVYFDMNEKFYKNADQFGLSIPFPQMDVHLDKA